MPRVPIWRPRSSSIGYYLKCPYRAAFDRAIAQGLMQLDGQEKTAVEAAKASSPYASFGTWCHFYLQDALRCDFEGGREQHIPSPETMASAAQLHGDDVLATEAAVRVAVTTAAKGMPIQLTNHPWLAESSCTSPDMTGHLDFLTCTKDHIVDLKMVSRKPDKGQVKAEHMAQVLGAYPALVSAHFQVQPKWATVLYVAMDGSWNCPITVDVSTPEMVAYSQSIMGYAKFLRGPQLFKMATPVIGAHCDDGWCPYRAICRDKIRPPAGAFSDHGVPTTFHMGHQGL